MSLNGMQRLWSDDDRKQVAELLLGGASASEVGKAMSLTRNAAIGRIARDPELHRLVQRAPRQRTLHLPPAPRRPRARIAAAVPLVPRPVKEEVVQAPERLMPLIDTGNQFCKWPVKHDPEVKGGVWCCGAPVRLGEVYCKHHRQQARRLNG